MTDLVTYIDGLGPAGYIYFSSVYIVAEVLYALKSVSLCVYVCVCVHGYTFYFSPVYIVAEVRIYIEIYICM